MYNFVLDICSKKFDFKDFEDCSAFYKSLINLFKQMNYSEFESAKFKEYKAEIDKLIASKEAK